MSANNDSIQKTLIVAVLLCLVCAIIVAGAAV
ncbi:MAG: Na(+)-translocating NADH-quinone reductase subunit C, partial [Pseudomonadota bacterium]|nr:Na(+)-translocating NADH-quinone reductase subunit C [Pseudomonadota bacterium]